VDTFEEEDVIDLDAVAQEIRDIDTQMKATDATIAAFCAELGISAPF
jgi:type I restriction enzyme M protein